MGRVVSVIATIRDKGMLRFGSFAFWDTGDCYFPVTDWFSSVMSRAFGSFGFPIVNSFRLVCSLIEGHSSHEATNTGHIKEAWPILISTNCTNCVESYLRP